MRLSVGSFSATTHENSDGFGDIDMICPDCGHDNIGGVDLCDACGQPLVEFDPCGSPLEESISRHSISVLAPKIPATVSASLSVKDAIAEMVNRKIGCVLVVEGEQLVGVFSERDVLNKVSPDLKALARPVSDFMTPSPVTIRKQDSIAYALHAMDLGGYRHMPIVDEKGRPTGIISVRDILRFLCVRFAEIRSAAG